MEDLIFEEKKSGKNSVWCYFLREKKGQLGKCKQCKNIIKTQGGSTSGLRTHLKTIHKINLSKRDISGSSILNTESVTAGCSQISAPASTSGKLTRYLVSDIETLSAVLARMTASDGLPFNIFITSKDIRKGLTARGFSNIPQSSNSIKKIVMDYSKEIRSQMIKEFSSRILRGESFSLTFDEWTSIQNRRYLNINVHSACKKIWNLGLARIHGSLPAEKCVELVDKKLLDNGLSLNKNIVCITTDGASVMTKVGRLINANQQLCFAHGIQLAVIKVLYKFKNLDIQYEEYSHNAAEFDEDYLSIIDDDEYTDEDLAHENGLTIINTECENPNDYMITYEQLGPLIDKIRKVVTIFRRSPTKNDKILQKYVNEEFGKDLALILDCKTRWNSLLNMLERFYKIRSCIGKALIDMNAKCSFSDNDFSLLSTVISGLLPVKLTLEACCRQDATLLSANAAFQFMFKELTKQNNPFSNKLKEELKIRILERQTELTSVLQYLHNCNNTVEDEEITDIMHSEVSKIGLIKIIANLLKRLHQTEDAEPAAISINEHDDSEIISSDSEQEADYLLTMKEKLEMEISKRIKINESVALKQKNTKDLNKVIRQELCYFEAENIRGKYLSLVYNMLLSIPPTSVESERAFSAAGILCTKMRSRLGDKSLDEMTFLRAYFNNAKK